MTAGTSADARPGRHHLPATLLRLLGRQVRAENRAFWRNPAAAFFTFAFRRPRTEMTDGTDTPRG